MPPTKKTVSIENKVSALLLTQKAEVKEIQLPLQKDGTLCMSTLKATLKKKTDPEPLGSYVLKSGAYFLFGFTSGKAGTENKHELPPPHDSVLTFGDMIMTYSTNPEDWAKASSLKASDYETFYTKAFGGFEELDEGESDSEEAIGEPLEEIEEGEAEESEEEEEEEIEEETEEQEGEEQEGEEDTELPVAPKVTKVKPKGKKSKKSSSQLGAAAAAAASYATYLHVDEINELRAELEIKPFDSKHLPEPRKQILKALQQLFQDKLDESEIQLLERAIYNGAIRIAEQRHIGKAWSHPPFIEIYKMHAKHIAANFHPDSYVKNNELFERYRSGETKLGALSWMDPYQLFESRWKDSFIQQQQREKRQLEGNKAMATDRFLCMRCHKRECTYYEMQTRSADEPMTIFITCLNCGKHWRQ